MKKIIVKACGDCPFLGGPENYGFCCYYDDSRDLFNEKRHYYHDSIPDEHCPLKKEPVQIEIGESGD